MTSNNSKIFHRTRDIVQDIDFTIEQKILVAPIGSAAIFCSIVESRACAGFVLL